MADTKMVDGINIGLGNRQIGLITHVGPASYTQVTPGTPPTGGDSVQASAFGLKFLEAVIALGLDNTGTYEVNGIVQSQGGGGATSALLLWNTANTGAQVSGATNLSASTVALLGIGR